VTEEQLREFFVSCGGVTSHYNKFGKVQKAYNREPILCTFKKDKALQKALSMNGSEYQGRKIVVGLNVKPLATKQQAEGSERVFVGNLPLDITPEKVEQMFSNS